MTASGYSPRRSSWDLPSAGPGAVNAGIVTTSHNPAPDNGVKLWTTSEQAFGEEHRDRIAEIIKPASFDFAGHDATVVVHRVNDARAYQEHALRESDFLRLAPSN